MKNDFLSKIKSPDTDYGVFEKYLSYDDPILDYQSGYGKDSLYFKDKYDVTAISYSAQLSSHLSKDIEKSFCVDIREAKFINRFKAIWVDQGFDDHDENLIIEILEKMFFALKKDGIILVNIKESQQKNIEFKKIIEKNNFDIIEQNKVTGSSLFGSETRYLYIIKRMSLLNK